MLNQRPENIAEAIREKFTVHPPIFLANMPGTLKAELKPYLQPFERVLATHELRALLEPGDIIEEEHGLYLITTGRAEEDLRNRLTYWQRLGRALLVPTLQKTIEFTQTGLEKASQREELHSARRLRYGPHDLHDYRGKFFPQLVRSLINISQIPDGAVVLDPMCGSGTTLCEAIAFSRSAIGADLNPLSVLISTVKAGIVIERPAAFLNAVERYTEVFVTTRIDPTEMWDAGDVEYLRRWFDPGALVEIAALLFDLKSVRSRLYKDFFRVCLSNIIRAVSWQKDTDLRVRKEVKPFQRGSVFEAFRTQVASQRDRIYPYLCVLHPQGSTPQLVVKHGNAVEIDRLLPENVAKCDLLVTSPPYATALPYLDTDRLSLIALGLLDRKSHRNLEASMVGTREVTEKQRQVWWELYQKRRRELPSSISRLIDKISETNHGPGIGFRRRNLPALLGKYFLDMLEAMRSAKRMMRPGAQAYYVVGNNSSTVGGEKIEIPTDHFLFELGAHAGWTPEEAIPMELIPSRDIFRENRGSTEAILHFRA